MQNSRFRSFLFTLVFLVLLASSGIAQNLDIAGPLGSERFGKQVFSLPNGNVVVTDPFYDAGPIRDVGAVYLYDGDKGGLISMMTGATGWDQIGNGGVTVLTNGNFVVISHYWNDDDTTRPGAVTWCSMTAGCPATISEANSLVGSRQYDSIGLDGVIALPGGNYVVLSPYWDLGTSQDRGAITWGNGSTGISGQVSETNSLYGAGQNDNAGTEDLTILSNGNYVVRCPSCTVAGISKAGAATFCPADSGGSGEINGSNSLVGSSANDAVGKSVAPLTNGNYVVSSPTWNNGSDPMKIGLGAVTWGSGTAGIIGAVSTANSLVGSKKNDSVGSGGVTALTNGNYVVKSSVWDNGSIENAGAATWGDGTTGITGEVSTTNSLTGSQRFDNVGAKVTALTNGNYVVANPSWSNGEFIYVGAVVWGDGTTGITGPVTAANSLHGSWHQDRVGNNGVVALPNGNFVVISSDWDNGSENMAGAVTWGSGTSVPTGPVNSSNSLVGSRANDQIGYGGVVLLNNGNYVVVSPGWSNGDLTGAGAVTWVNGTTGRTGPLSESNSLTGGYGDAVGSQGVTPLSNGNYVVASPGWDNGPISQAGAATWGNGMTGISGRVSAANSLVGTSQDDYVGMATVTNGGPVALPGGDYVVVSFRWDGVHITDAGAVTICNGLVGKKGVVSAANSLLGTTAYAGGGMSVSFDGARNQLAIGRAGENLVTLVRQAIPAASASVSGKVTDANGTPIRNAIVSLTAPGGQRIAVQTGSMGLYLFENVPTGQAYTVVVSSKRYRFNLPPPVFIDGDLANLDIMARPQEF